MAWSLFRNALLALAVAAGLSPGAAFAAQQCGLTTVNGGTANLTYDPFNGNNTNINLTGVTLSRVNLGGGNKTANLEFYVKGTTAAQNGTVLIPTSATGSGSGGPTGSNIFFGTNQTPPTLNINSGSPAPGVFRWAFTGNNAASDVFTLNITLQLPANLNLTAGSTLPFDIVYSCNGTGNGGPFTDTGTVSNAIVVNVTVLSGLQASYVGTNLDFVEVGNLTTAAVLGAPGTYTTPTTNYIRVASSGPYSVSIASTNNYKLTFPGGSAGNPLQSLAYKALFLGQTPTTASP
ncbi:MAG: hypothetical protein ACTHJR_19145, partial [Sphingomonas sp.]|uniref:hypothetical protein n=1 Tax=Sphingomonas sp. TaxID=28214 RepID=UPI003F7FA25C